LQCGFEESFLQLLPLSLLFILPNSRVNIFRELIKLLSALAARIQKLVDPAKHMPTLKQQLETILKESEDRVLSLGSSNTVASISPLLLLWLIQR